MITHLIYLAVIAFLVFVIVKLALRNIRLKENYEAIEEGMSEVTDAYESDMLQWMESNSKANEQIEMAESHASYMSDFVEKKDDEIETLRDSLAEKVVLLNIAITILKRHDEKCLPTLVEEDEILLKDLLEHVDSP